MPRRSVASSDLTEARPRPPLAGGGDIAAGDRHISAPHKTDLQLLRQMRDLVPGGFLFTHLIFWSVVALVAVGTNAVAIILSMGLGLLVVETVSQQK